MRKTFFTLIFAMMISMLSFGQLTGIKTIPGDYSSVSNAIFALNSLGVGPGGVTFNVAAGHTETFPMLNSGLITATGTISDPIIFQRSGSGANPVITGCVTGPNTTDYVIALQGTDYITFDGIDIAEPSGVIEWGYAILKESAQNGSQNVTIKHCNITLKKTNTATVGIYSANITPVTPGTPVPVDAQSGSNSNNKFYSNTITGCYSGIVINGFADPTAPYALYDQSTEIGKDGGNMITSFGGSTVADYGIYTSYQNRMTIANNTINGTVDGNGACAGIQMNTANNASTNVYSNTISIAYTGAGAFYGIYNNMGTTFTDNIFNFYSNTVTNCTCANAVSGAFYGLYNYITAATITWNNCQVTNNTYGSGSTTSTGTVAYMYLFGSPSTPATVHFFGNSVTGNTRVQSVVGGGATYYMYISGGGTTGPLTNVYNNLVDNNTPVTTGGVYGYYFLNGASVKNFYNNTFSNLLNGRGTIYSIYTGNGYTTNIYNNKVQNINSIAASTAVYGINLSSSTGSGTMNVYNNFVSELKTPNSTTAVSQYGIYGGATSTTNLNIYYNTVYLDGTSAGAGFGSVGLYIGSNPASVDLRNNIIVNNTTPTGAGLAIAIKSGVTLATNIASITNNNDYYAGTPGANHLIFNDGTNSDQTLIAYKARMFPRESNSITENPPFTQVATTPYNLHVNAAVATQCESAGLIVTTPVSVSNDFDSDARFPESGYPNNLSYPATAPDLGADEFAGMPLDLIPPVITFTPLMNTMSVLDRTLTATITDASGVPVSGDGLPRVCWKVNYTGTWAYATGTSDGNNQYSFSFGAGTTLGDTIYYFVVAQDASAAKNVGTFPILGSGGYSANPPTASTPPTLSKKYVIIQGICGTFTVGAGKDFETLTAAINSINIKELTCPVTLLLTDNIYSAETYPIIINQIQGASAVNTLTIKPAPGATPNFPGSYLGVTPNYWSMITLNGAQYVTIDGSNSGGTDKSLTFQNSAPAGYAAVIGLYNNGTIGAGNFTIRNCVIKAHSDNLYNAQGITMYATTGNGGFHDIVIHNNTVNSAKFGIQVFGTANNKAINVEISNNMIGDMSLVIAQYAISMSNTDNVLITGNEMIGAAQGMAVGPVTAGIYINAGCTNTRIRKNIIHDFYQTGTAFPMNGAEGIVYLAEATSLTEITDNVIYNIKSPGQSTSPAGANPFGIFIQYGGNIKIQHNTIYMGGNYLSATVPGMSACIGLANNITLLDIRDNILKNSSQPTSGTPASKSYCITAGTNPGFTNLNNNDYFCDGIGATIGYYGGADKTTLVDWQTATGMDANTLNIDPVFTGSNNFVPTTTAMPKAGVYIPALPTDLANVTRTNPPDIGAYEFTTMPVVVTTAATDVTAAAATLNGTINPSAMDVNVYFDYGTTTSYGTTVYGTPFTVSGSLVIGINAPITGLTANTTYHFRVRAVTFGGVAVYGNDMTFSTLPGIPENITVGGEIGGGLTPCYNASNTITVGGPGNPFSLLSGSSATFIAWQKISFLPGTQIQSGSYMHGYISPGTYCNTPAMPSVAAGAGEVTPAQSLDLASFIIYPNPTNGNFTLLQKGVKIAGTVKIEIYSVRGDKVMTESMIGEKQHEFSTSDLKTGLYFVKVLSEGYAETLKLVKL